MGDSLYERILALGEREVSRFHMPGHKGRLALFDGQPFARYDLTEIPGADSLYDAGDVIADCEAAYAGLYGAAGTALSAGGSTLCIQAMLALAGPPGSRILAARGCHAAAIHAMTLLDLDPIWMATDSRDGFPEPVSPDQLAAMLDAHPQAAAVYLTSPTYDGRLSDIGALAALCHAHGKKLLVDGAHGAHLPFLADNLHPIHLGADFCCDSLHKTLPVLTGGALLHTADPAMAGRLKDAMRLFGSTSPSYLILASIDAARAWLETDGPAALRAACDRMAWVYDLCREEGWITVPPARDPMRLTQAVAANGWTAAELRAACDAHRIEPELIGEDYAVFLGAPMLAEEDWSRLEALCRSMPHRAPRPIHRPAHLPERVMSPREAFIRPRRLLPAAEAVGHIAAQVNAPCPPGIPLVVPGERIEQQLEGEIWCVAAV